MCVSCVLNFLSFTFCLLFFRFLCDSSFVLFDFSAKLQKKEDIYLFIHGYRFILKVSKILLTNTHETKQKNKVKLNSIKFFNQ